MFKFLAHPLARPLLVLAALAALAASILAVAGYVDRLRGQAAAYTDCRELVGHPEGEAGACDPVLAATIVAAAKARACDAGLAAERVGPGAGVLAVARFCSGPVKALDGQALTLARQVADRDDQLVALRADQAANIDAAVSRAQTFNRRQNDAEKTIAGAPRDPRGRVVCGLDCLRQLGGEARLRPGS